MCTHAKRSHTHVKDPVVFVREIGGLWKHQNNSACAKSVSLRSVEVGNRTEEQYWEDRWTLSLNSVADQTV